MAMTWLTRLSREAPVPVHAAIGPACLAATERLLARTSLVRTATPRQAAILLVAGHIPKDHRVALDRLHDQIPTPRLTVYWNGYSDDVEEVVIDRWCEVCVGAEGEPDRLPDEPPNAWRGRGKHGQGGEGMMGGVPYGRRMAMTGADVRDGLQLDRYTARIGPFASMLPPGLVLEVTLQGDVIVDCDVVTAPFEQSKAADAPALCASRMLRLLGLQAAADRLIRANRAFAFGTRWALPRGLGHLQGQGDVRARLATWLAGKATGDAPGIFGLLVGLEWSEAMLVLSSVTPSALCRAAVEPKVVS